MRRVYYLLHVEKQGVLGQILLNGVPLRIWPDAARFETTDPVNFWIRPGVNTIGIELHRPPDASDPQFRLVVSKMTESAAGQEPTETVLEYDLPALDEAAYPFQFELNFTAADPPPSALWSLLTGIELTPENREQVLTLVDQIQAAFHRKDLDRLSQLLRFKALDVAQCFYFPTQQALQSQREFFAGLMQDAAWAMQPYRHEDLNPHLIADDQLIWVTREDYAPALRSQPSTEGTSFALPLYIADIRGAWTVVR